MFNNIVLDIFIGLVFIFLLYSLLATILMELYARAFNLRARMLQKALRRMLEDDENSEKEEAEGKPIWKKFTLLSYFYDITVSLVRFFNPNWQKEQLIKKFYKHPSIKYLGEDNTSSKPSYLHCHNFSQTILQMLRGAGYDASNQNESELIKNALDYNLLQIKKETLQHLKDLFADARQDSQVFKIKLEDWFDETMHRANGWYKKQTQVILILMGFYVAFLFNVDTVAIYKILATDKEARKILVQMAINNNDRNKATIMALDTNYVSDSLLKQTYQSVAADAEKANSILALGKPWKDSCEICRDSFPTLNLTNQPTGSKAYKKFIDSHQKNANQLGKRIEVLRVNLKDSLLVKNRSADTRLLDSFINLKMSLDTTIRQAKIQVFNNPQKRQFAERCRFIKAQTDKTWFKYSPNQQGGWTTFFGWLLTALAISMGAPFWFDLLSKFIQIRTTGNRPRGDQPPANAGNGGNGNATATTPDGKTIRG